MSHSSSIRQKSSWPTRFNSTRHQQMVLSVAIVMLVLVGATIFAPAPFATINPVANGTSSVTTAHLPIEHRDAFARTSANSKENMFADWIPSRFPSISDVQFDSWGTVDFSVLVPKEPADTVRGFPVAIESVAPFYRYSAEIPVVNQWANGISYTLNLLRAKFPIGVTTPSLPDNGFGAFPDSEWLMTC